MLIRTNINLEAKQLEHAKHFCADHDLSLSELVRQALTEYITANKAPESLFGLLKNQLPDGLKYQQKIRAHED